MKHIEALQNICDAWENSATYDPQDDPLVPSDGNKYACVWTVDEYDKVDNAIESGRILLEQPNQINEYLKHFKLYGSTFGDGYAECMVCFSTSPNEAETLYEVMEWTKEHKHEGQ